MATSLTLENDSSLAQGYLKVNGSTAATLTTSGITGNLTGNVTGNADTATKFSTTTGSAPAYACRAWVHFDGTRDTTGAVSTANTNRLIRASGNVSSVLRNSVGNYTITFTIAMTDAFYCPSGMCYYDNASNYLAIPLIVTLNTGSFRVISAVENLTTGVAVPLDTSVFSVQIFGN
jgi:hypothetical protein